MHAPLKSVIAGLVLCLLLPGAAPAQDATPDFIKTYRAYSTAYRQGDLQRAADLAQKTLELAVKELGPDHEKIPVLLINLGHVDLLLGKYDDAEKFLQQAQKQIKPGQAGAVDNLVTVHEDLANVYTARKQLDQARTELQQAVALRSKHSGADDPQLAELYGMQARIEAAEKHYAAAEKLLDQGMQILTAKYGKDDNRVAGYITLRGDVAAMRNDLPAAAAQYLKALTILQKNLLADDPAVLAMQQKLANLYIVMGSDKFAEYADAYIAHAELREGAALPAFIIKPQLPAAGRPDQAWVLLNMTVTEQGRITDLKVVEADAPAAITKATLAAAAKWRFKPRIQDGKRLAQVNTRARIVFRGDKVDVHLGEMGQPDTAQ